MAKSKMKDRVFRGFYLPEELANKLDKYALLLGVSLSSALRMIVIKFLRDGAKGD